MKEQSINWACEYKKTKDNPVYLTEWIIRTIAGVNYLGCRLTSNVVVTESKL